MNFGFENNKNNQENDIKLRMCKIQQDLDRTIMNEHNFKNKLDKLNHEKMNLKKSYECLDNHRKLNSKRRSNLAMQVNNFLNFFS